MAEFVRIQDPKKKGDYLVVSQKDYHPEKHKLFEERAQEKEGEKEKGSKPKG